jgi:hypothetical protein
MDERASMTGEQEPRSRTGVILHSLVLAILLVSLGWTTAPQLLRLVVEAHELQPLSRAARRARVNGPVVASVGQVKRTLSPGEPVALIGPVGNYAPVIFANYYGYPWASRDYAGLDHYRAMAGDPLRPKTIVAVSDAGARLATYAGLRDERLRRHRVVHEEQPRPMPLRFAIPLVGSVDGLPPDTYVTEAELVNDNARPAQVRLTMMPEQRVVTLTVVPHGSIAFYDLLYQLFGVMEVRWVAVESDQPLRGGAWFVNRGRNQTAPLPFVTAGAGGPLICPADECKLWVLNLNDEDTTVVASGAPLPLPAHSLLSRPFRGGVLLLDAPGVFAFASTKAAPTRFVWPRGVRP